MIPKDEKEIYRRSQEIINSGRQITEDYAGFTDEEALILILPSVGYKKLDAQFILDMARGRLPESYIDEDGRKVCIVY